MRDKTVCFTEHRVIPALQREGLFLHLKSTILSLMSRGYRFFGAGGAWGFDTLAAMAVLEIRKQYPFIKLILVLPCYSQARYWKDSERKRYEQIKELADKVVYTSFEYTRGCMYRRNRHLVNCSSVCVCYLTKNVGGTAYTVAYAKRQGLEIINMALEGKSGSKR